MIFSIRDLSFELGSLLLEGWLLNLTDVIIDKNYACKIWNMKGFYKNGRGSCCNI